MCGNSAFQRVESQGSKKQMGAKFSLRCGEQHRGSSGAVPRPAGAGSLTGGFPLWLRGLMSPNLSELLGAPQQGWS